MSHKDEMRFLKLVSTGKQLVNKFYKQCAGKQSEIQLIDLKISITIKNCINTLYWLATYLQFARQVMTWDYKSEQITFCDDKNGTLIVMMAGNNISMASENGSLKTSVR